MDRPNSINQKFTNINKCDICFNSYNRSTRQPVIICSMHHTICRQCMESLHSKPDCPFCREKIRFDKVVVNNYINQLLPQQAPKANTRVAVPQSRQNNMPAEANRFAANQPSRSMFVNQNNGFQNINREYSAPNFNNQILQRYPMPPPVAPVPVQSINNRPLQRVYDDDFQNYNQEINSYEHNEVEADRATYYCLYILQLPFTFFNLWFALTSPQSQCMDKPHRLTILIVRPWFLSMGIIQLVLMLTFLFVYFLCLKKIISMHSFQKARIILGAIFFIKVIVWIFTELQLFEAGIGKYCSGGIFAYGVVLTVLHSIVILAICCVAQAHR